MTDALKKVLEETSLSESAKVVIAEAWETKIQEAREEITASLRDEFALKYEKDKGELVEAMNTMISDTLQTHVEELAEAKKAALQEKVLTRKKINESVNVFSDFIGTQLAKELQEFRADRKAVNTKVNVLDKFVKENLTKELVEFHEDKRKLVEDRVELKINAKRELAETKKQLIKSMSTVCETFIRKHLIAEMTQLKGELIEAKRKNFGTKVFEAFAAEFGASFFSERAEMKKLLNVIEAQNKKIDEVKQQIAKKDQIIAESTNKYRIIEDRFARTKLLNEKCSSLTGSKRKLMEQMLEKVPTNKLTESFNAYLPSVISADTSRRQPLDESNVQNKFKEVTGNKHSDVTDKKIINEGSVASEVVSSFLKMEKYANTKGIV